MSNLQITAAELDELSPGIRDIAVDLLHSAPAQKETRMIAALWARCFIGAALAVIVGLVVDNYVPLQPIAHDAAILLYVAGLIAAVAGVFYFITARRGPLR